MADHLNGEVALPTDGGPRMGRAVLEPEDHVGAYLYPANKELSRSVTGVVINSGGGLGGRGLTKLAGLL